MPVDMGKPTPSRGSPDRPLPDRRAPRDNATGGTGPGNATEVYSERPTAAADIGRWARRGDRAAGAPPLLPGA